MTAETAPEPAGSGPLGTDMAKLPLVRRMLEDPEVELVKRPVHEDWAYSKLSTSVKGWNPWSGKVYVSARSALVDWLKQPERPLRELNEGDLLVPEVLFAVHDYLHIWSVRFIQERVPDAGLGFGPITPENAEKLAFLALLTEAVATAGVDYWYLSATDLNRTLPIGTRLRGLTVSYREEDLDEHRRGFAGLVVQDPKFFTWLCRLYTVGVAGGFDNTAVRTSPLTMQWLEKELKYGQLQREYTRSWLEHLSGVALYAGQTALRAPVDFSEPWQRELVAELGQALWDLVKEDRADPTPAGRERSWASPGVGPFDPRFDNFAALSDPEATVRDRGLAGGFRYLFAQALGMVDYAECGKKLKPSLEALEASGSVELLFEVLGHYPKITEGDAGPKDMFFMS